MPRTKIRNALNKRNRRNSTEDKLENLIRDLDAYADSFFCDLDFKHQQNVEEITILVDLMRSKTPNNIRKMTMGDIKKLQSVTQFSDITMGELNTTNYTMMNLMDSSSAKTKLSRDDEGYLTEEGVQNDILQQSIIAPLRNCGPLESALAKSRRRSKSMSDKTTYTPALSQSVSNKVQKSAQRLSRSKYRTPSNLRPKAISADRFGLITPKVQPNMAMAILRHAKAGENVFSITGSPVITSNISEGIANVNIPVHNGVLSLRPTDMGAIDSQFISKIDKETLMHLKKLQANLNTLVNFADREHKY